MKVREIAEALNAEILCGFDGLDTEISCAFGSDLMSDVLAFVKGKTVLLTGLINQQVIRTAEMADLSAIVFVRGKKPEEDIIRLAQENNIIVLLTRDTLYSASGKLYARGLAGIQLD